MGKKLNKALIYGTGISLGGYVPNYLFDKFLIDDKIIQFSDQLIYAGLKTGIWFLGGFGGIKLIKVIDKKIGEHIFNSERKEKLTNEGLEVITNNYDNLIVSGENVSGIMGQIGKAGQEEGKLYYLNLSSIFADENKITERIKTLEEQIFRLVKYNVSRNYHRNQELNQAVLEETYSRKKLDSYQRLLGDLPTLAMYLGQQTLFVNLGDINNDFKLPQKLDEFLGELSRKDVKLVLGVSDPQKAEILKRYGNEQEYNFGDIHILG